METRNIVARLLLSVYVPMVLIVSLHTHEVERDGERWEERENARQDCEWRANDDAHEGHVQAVVDSESGLCLLCQLSETSYVGSNLSEKSVVTALVLEPVAFYDEPKSQATFRLSSPRAPPFCV